MRVRAWKERFEINRTREIKMTTWRPEPINSDLYVEVVSHEDGAAHYGVLTAVRNIAAKGNPRGSLTREGGRAHDVGSLARLARIPEPLMRAAIDRLIAIGEIEIPASREGATFPHPDAGMSQAQNYEPQEGAGIPRYKTDKTDKTDRQVGQTDTRAGARSLSPISPQEARLTDREISEAWTAAGFDCPEDFETWFKALYAKHPTRGMLQVGQDVAREAILAGELKRDVFESVYAAYCDSPEWKKSNGRYIPQLAKLISDKFWQFPPVVPAAAEENWA